MTGWLVVLSALVVGLAAWPAICEWRRKVIDGRRRQGEPGHFLRLSQGVTYCRWHGPVRGKVIVAVHGLTTPSQVWSALAPGLALLGYRVLTYDLYGRGLSDAPSGAQDRAFFLRQLGDLLAAEELTGGVTLMGYSMGGSIATAYTAAHPDQVDRLILIATAGLSMAEDRFDTVCRRVPVLGDWLFGFAAARLMRQAILSQPPGSGGADLQQDKLAQLGRRGYLPAILSSRRGMLAEDQANDHRRIATTEVPVVAIWGGADRTIPISALGLMAACNRGARQEVVDTADHGLPYTHASQVETILSQILAESR